MSDQAPLPLIHLHYLRPPNRRQIYKQHLIAQEPEAYVTLSTDLTLESPFEVNGTTILETGSRIIWFTFPNAWHDIGLFHKANGHHTGIYANILTPLKHVSPFVWETTDLFLDIWINPNDECTVLDEDEFTIAKQSKWISSTFAKNALTELKLLIDGHRNGTWPPQFIFQWDLDRALSQLG